ncbi:MAG: acetyl-CoA carboxylase subunit alpha [Frankiales bacterium]|nr:acetyl-CoA carboxylase subunit alpha [Frankiales bacterium]
MIGTLLVANRGEIALRIVRTAREMDIATVVVFSDPDAGEPFVAAADEAVRLPGAAPADTYLRGDLILAAARATGADAVHPGYGFLSENAGFARDCRAAGVTFVGPSPEAIEAMGSKTAAKERMAAAGVPVLPGVVIGARGQLDVDALGEAAAGIGYPLLVKAAFGGGGRGMRIVRSADELADAVAGARREADAAFGDGTVFLERYLEQPRHVEVQVFADSRGNVVHLFERECSIQRRYQKVIEEAPSPAVTPELRAELGNAAVAAAKAIDYVGAGTVEFVVDRSGRFFFLEMNTRLQVEHAVTEAITGLDLVRLQLQVADGQRLPDTVPGAGIGGHAVEARLYAEDVAAGFLPGTGTVHRFSVPSMPGLRVDAGVAEGSVVGVHYDPMLAKVIAHAPTRDAACRLLARALTEIRVHGVVTNRDLLVGILREAEFRRGSFDTGYLTRHDPAQLAARPGAGTAIRLHALAAALAGAAARRAAAPVQPAVPSGWRNVPGGDQIALFREGDRKIEVRYGFTRNGLAAAVDGEPVDVDAAEVTPERAVVTVAGVRRAVDVHRVGDTVWLDSALGSTELTELPRFAEPAAEQEAGSLLAPMPGTVVRVEVAEGERVGAGTVVVVLEAMKMEHAVRAPAGGVVTALAAAVGRTVQAGQVLAVVTEVAVQDAEEPEPPS